MLQPSCKWVASIHASTCKCSKPKATTKYAAYVDAKKKINAIRTARGFYPVVALTGGQFPAGANPVAARGPIPPKGRSKSSKGKREKENPPISPILPRGTELSSNVAKIFSRISFVCVAVAMVIMQLHVHSISEQEAPS